MLPRRVWALALAGCFFVPLSPSAQQAAVDHNGVVTKYCVSCHNERSKIAGLMLDRANIADPSATADVWEKAIRKMRVGMMPPQAAPHPDPQAQTALISYLTTALDLNDQTALLAAEPEIVHR